MTNADEHVVYINVHNARFGKLPGAFDIDRGTPLGNRFIIGRDGTREEVIAKYIADWDRLVSTPRGAQYFRFLVVQARTRKGTLHLQCWCKPLGCHGDHIKAMIEQELARTQELFPG